MLKHGFSCLILGRRYSWLRITIGERDERSISKTIDYARISITDRCNLYCTYCRPDHEEMLSHGEILRYEEILRVCKILTTLGIDKFKITGGEPLVRKGCSNFIRELKKTDGVNKVTLTTNGILLSKDLVKLAEAGVDGINISLDFMDQEKYKKITGFDGTNRSYQ